MKRARLSLPHVIASLSTWSVGYMIYYIGVTMISYILHLLENEENRFSENRYVKEVATDSRSVTRSSNKEGGGHFSSNGIQVKVITVL